MRHDHEFQAYIPKFDTTDWRIGFEVEMLFGDLGLKRYREVIDLEGGYDVVPMHFCKAIAQRLSKRTGEEWIGTEEPEGQGCFVVPEPDLDPSSFSQDTVGGVELITPPRAMAEAEALRDDIIASVTAMKNGYTPHWDEHFAGWHVNVDKGERDDIAPEYVCAGLWEGAECELELLIETRRYGNGNRYAAPQHHAYGPALLTALQTPPFPLASSDLHGFLHHHCGRSKRFATNFGKLEQGYLELRHLCLFQFMENEDDRSTADYLDTVFKAMTIAPSNSGPYLDRLLDRFTLLAEWLHPLQDRFSIKTSDERPTRTRAGRLFFDGEEFARVFWVLERGCRAALWNRRRRAERVWR